MIIELVSLSNYLSLNAYYLLVKDLHNTHSTQRFSLFNKYLGFSLYPRRA